MSFKKVESGDHSTENDGEIVGDDTPNNLLHLAALPSEVRRRVKALKKNQADLIKLEAQKDMEIFLLEKKYNSKFLAVYDKRKDIVTGGCEPSDSDCELPWEEVDHVEEMAAAFADSNIGNAVKTDGDPVVPSGVPGFWHFVLRSCTFTAELIKEYDAEILNFLIDIRHCISEDDEKPSFVLEFCFSENPYFTNRVLCKTYYVRLQPPDDDPLSYGGEEIIAAEGTVIHWNKGKNVTVRRVRKRAKGGKGHSERKAVTKMVKQDSFFNFFEPPTADAAEEDEDVADALHHDFMLGDVIRGQLIPRATLYFTGDMNSDEEYESEDEEDGDEDDEHGEDEEDEEEEED